LIFALHPVCVESVAWISSKKYALSGLLPGCRIYLPSVLMRLRENPATSGQWIIHSRAFKQVCHRDLAGGAAHHPLVAAWADRMESATCRRCCPGLARASVQGCLLHGWKRLMSALQGADYSLTLLQRCLLAGRAVWFYLAKLFWPSTLLHLSAFYYRCDRLAAVLFLAGLLAL